MESLSILLLVLMIIFGTTINGIESYNITLASVKPTSIIAARDPRCVPENPRNGFRFEATKDLYGEALAVLEQTSGNFIAKRVARYEVDGTDMNLVRLLNPPYDIYLKKIDSEDFEVLYTEEKQFITIDDIPSLPAHAPPGVLPLEDLIECAKHWSLINGLGTRSKKNYSKDSVIFVPFTLLPSPFPKSEYDRAIDIQPLLNELIHKVAHDHEFLTNSLKTIAKLDDFTQKLWNIYQIVYEEGFSQEYSVGLFRSDYMLDGKDGNPSIKQIEVNTMAAGYVSYGARATALHRFVLERLQRFEDIPKLPENNAAKGLGAGLAKGWELYRKPSAAILFVVGEESYPIGDHRGHEFGIYETNPHITVLRRTYSQLTNGRGKLNKKKEYFVDGKEIGLVYYRAGYDPSDFNNDEEWQVRLDIERSKALKCPSIQYHLAGIKKIQQVLATENILSRFLSDSEVEKIKSTFTGLYTLDLNPAGDEAAEMALKDPERFVMKPQREGGGNNLYGTDIVKMLTKIGRSEERASYILMDRIIPPSNSTYIIRPNSDEKLVKREVVSELGIFSVIIGSNDEIVVNTTNGHLHRTKNKMDYEGFILGGTGGIDSPILYE